MRKHQLVSRHVEFKPVYISSLPKSIVCTEQVSYGSDLSQDQCRRSVLSPRFVTSCVLAFKRLYLNNGTVIFITSNFDEQDKIQLFTKFKKVCTWVSEPPQNFKNFAKRCILSFLSKFENLPCLFSLVLKFSLKNTSFQSLRSLALKLTILQAFKFMSFYPQNGI